MASHLGGRIPLIVARQVDVSGVVTGVPWQTTAGSVYVAAIGHGSTWLAGVDGNGWFAFEGLLPASYRLVLYHRSTPAEGTFELAEQGQRIMEQRVDCTHPRHDVVLRWKQEE